MMYVIGDYVKIRDLFDGTWQIKEGKIVGINIADEMYHGEFDNGVEHSFTEAEIIKR